MSPWLRLIRWDRPIGSYLLFWPAIIALCLAADGTPSWRYVLIFGLGVLLSRSAGCVINDWADRQIDGHVARTRMRPLVTGEIAPTAVWGIFGALLLACALLVMIWTNFYTWILAVIAAGLLTMYPFMKRMTFFPQLFLGIAYAWPVPMAFAAQTGSVPMEAGWVFFAVFFWVVGFDTVYAMADREEDIQAGIRSIARWLGRVWDRWALIGCWVASLGCWWQVGQVFALSDSYGLGLLVVALHFGWQVGVIWRLEPAQEAVRCLQVFRSNAWIGCYLGIAIELGLLLH